MKTRTKGQRLIIVIMILIVLIGLVSIFYMASGPRYYQLVGIFSQSDGLITGQEVRCLGQRIGSIQSIEVLPRERVIIVMKIIRSINIPQGASLEIHSNSLVGNKSLNIIIPDSIGPTDYQPGDTLWGKTPITFTELQNKLAALVDTLMIQVGRIDIQAINQTVSDLGQTARRLDEVAQKIDSGFGKTIDSVNQTLADFRCASNNIEVAAASVDSLARKGSVVLDSLPSTIKTFKSTMERIRRAIFWAK